VNRIHQLLPTENAAGTLQKYGQQLEFAAGQRNVQTIRSNQLTTAQNGFPALEFKSRFGIATFGRVGWRQEADCFPRARQNFA